MHYSSTWLNRHFTFSQSSASLLTGDRIISISPWSRVGCLPGQWLWWWHWHLPMCTVTSMEVDLLWHVNMSGPVRNCLQNVLLRRSVWTNVELSKTIVSILNQCVRLHISPSVQPLWKRCPPYNYLKKIWQISKLFPGMQNRIEEGLWVRLWRYLWFRY